MISLEMLNALRESLAGSDVPSAALIRRKPDPIPDPDEYAALKLVVIALLSRDTPEQLFVLRRQMDNAISITAGVHNPEGILDRLSAQLDAIFAQAAGQKP